MGSTTTSAVRKMKEFGSRAQKRKSTEVAARLANVTDGCTHSWLGAPMTWPAVSKAHPKRANWWRSSI
jgi:hypothetical protein